jgi:hypothetical protein
MAELREKLTAVYDDGFARAQKKILAVLKRNNEGRFRLLTYSYVYKAK